MSTSVLPLLQAIERKMKPGRLQPVMSSHQLHMHAIATGADMRINDVEKVALVTDTNVYPAPAAGRRKKNR